MPAPAANAGTVSEAKTAAKKASAGVGAIAHKGQRRGPQPAKYLDPKTGATWSGRGPAPTWLAAAKDRSKFLIAGADVGSADAGSAKVAGKKASAKTVAAKKAAATKPTAKKAPAKKAVTAKTADRKVTVKATQKPAGKKVPTKKTSPRAQP
jgi:hypothetical protein